jgi:hypothetical protein
MDGFVMLKMTLRCAGMAMASAEHPVCVASSLFCVGDRAACVAMTPMGTQKIKIKAKGGGAKGKQHRGCATRSVTASVWELSLPVPVYAQFFSYKYVCWTSGAECFEDGQQEPRVVRVDAEGTANVHVVDTVTACVRWEDEYEHTGGEEHRTEQDEQTTPPPPLPLKVPAKRGQAAAASPHLNPNANEFVTFSPPVSPDVLPMARSASNISLMSLDDGETLGQLLRSASSASLASQASSNEGGSPLLSHSQAEPDYERSMMLLCEMEKMASSMATTLGLDSLEF